MRSPKYRSTFIVGIMLSACLIGFDRRLPASAQEQANEDPAIRALVQQLFELYQQKDIDRLSTFWSGKSPFLAENRTALQREFAAYEKIAVKGFEIRQTRVEGDQKTLRVAVAMALTRAHLVKAVEKAEKKNRTIQLVKEGESWKVWKFVLAEDELAAAIIAAKTESAWSFCTRATKNRDWPIYADRSRRRKNRRRWGKLPPR